MLRFLLSVSLFCSAGAAHAQPRTSSLSWVRLPGAEGCIGSRPLAEAVEARLRRPVFVSAAEAELAVEGRVEPATDGARWRASIVLSNAAGEVLGERTLESPGEDCGELSEPLALVIAVMIDPDAAMRTEEPEPEPPREEPEVREVVRTERVEVEVPVVREGPRWEVEIDVGAGAVFGVIADAAPLVFGSVYVVPPRLFGIELGLGLAYMRLSPEGGGDHDLGYGFASIAACPLSVGTTLSLAACAGVHLGAVRVWGDQAEERVTVDLLVRARLAWRVLPWLALNLRPALLVPLRREDFQWSGGTLYAPWVVAPMIDLGAGVRF